MLLVSGEYATGQIKLTFTAVPRRLPVLWGKAVAIVLSVLAVSLASTLTAFFVTQAILAPHHLSTTLGTRASRGPSSAARCCSPVSRCSAWPSARCCAAPPA